MTKDNEIKSRHGLKPVDGLLGTNILLEKDAIIDYGAKQLLLKGDFPDHMYKVHERLLKLPIVVDKTRLAAIERGRLFSLSSDNKWSAVAEFKALDREVSYEVPDEGCYVFALQAAMKDGTLLPASFDSPGDLLQVIVVPDAGRREKSIVELREENESLQSEITKLRQQLADYSSTNGKKK
jgi:hypothetical protein